LSENNKESGGASSLVFFVSLSEDGFILGASSEVFSCLEIKSEESVTGLRYEL